MRIVSSTLFLTWSIETPAPLRAVRKASSPPAWEYSDSGLVHLIGGDGHLGGRRGGQKELALGEGGGGPVDDLL